MEPGRRPTRDEVLASLQRNNWSQNAAAKELGRDRKYIARLIDSYAIEIPGRRVNALHPEQAFST